jgi:hypothetical protein
MLFAAQLFFEFIDAAVLVFQLPFQFLLLRLQAQQPIQYLALRRIGLLGHYASRQHETQHAVDNLSTVTRFLSIVCHVSESFHPDSPPLFLFVAASEMR